MTQATKLNGFAVIGPKSTGITVNKEVGYAVVGPSSDRLTVSKVVAYAVVVDASLLPKGTFRWMSCTNRGLGLS